MGRHIGFGADPAGASIIFDVAFCLRSNLLTVEWIYTKLSQILIWDTRKEWLYFGDRDLTFKVTRVI